MLKIEAVIQPHKLDEVRVMLKNLGIGGAMIHQVIEHDGRSKAYYRGAEYPAEIPRIKIELLISPERAEEVVSGLMRSARTSSGDDGTILICEVADAIRIHTGAHLQYTLS